MQNCGTGRGYFFPENSDGKSIGELEQLLRKINLFQIDMPAWGLLSQTGFPYPVHRSHGLKFP